MPAQRKLAAILSADVVGYSRLMAEDEAATVEQVKALRETLTDLVRRHGGRVVDAVGDNLLADFPSIVDGVRGAVVIQEEVAKQNEGRPEERRMLLRIGVNLGDVIVDEGRIYGDGVNVAARVEALAEPGGVAISGSAFEHVHAKLDFAFEDLGEHDVKNIPTPIRIYRVGDAARDEPAPEPSERGAIAVLPFENMSGDPDQEYFADGISEDLITRLLSYDHPIIARNSSFAFKGRNVDVKKIGRELGARFVIEGSVRKSAGRVRITAQLIDAETGHHLWGEKYDRELDDVFKVQDEIAIAIPAAMSQELWNFETSRVARRAPQSLDAWDSMMRGSWHASQKDDREQAELAKQFYERAIELDPEFATAWAFLSTMHYEDATQGWSDSREASLRQMFECAQRAVSLDPGQAICHVAMAFWHNQDGAPERALASADRAIELSPSWSGALTIRAQLRSLTGDVDGAVQDLEKSSELNPKEAHKNFSPLAIAHFSAHRYEEVVRWAERAREMNQKDMHANGLLASSYAFLGQLDKARERAADLPEYSEQLEQALRQLLSSATDDFVERTIEGLRRAGWHG